MQRFRLRPRWAAALLVALFANAATAAPADNFNVVRDLVGRVGLVLGSAFACPDIAQSRVRSVADRLQMVIKQVSSTDAERQELARLYDSSYNRGSNAIRAEVDCPQANQQLAELEKTFAEEGGSDAPAAAPAPEPAVQGVTANEIRFGIVAPLSGASMAIGRQIKLGIETAFSRVNDAGGIDGRMLRLVAADDESNPARTLGAMKLLYEKEKVFAFIGNVGTPTAAVAIPYALERHTLFFGAFTGSRLARNDPPDRYVFNYRVSSAEEIRAIMQYLLKSRRLQPRQIAVLSAQDAHGDDVFALATKTLRALGAQGTGIVRLSYNRNSLDVSQAVNQLSRTSGHPLALHSAEAPKKPPVPQVKAVIMVAPYRIAAKFIEATRDLRPDMIYASLSLVGSTELADELMLLGPRYADGVIVTQAVPPVSGYSSAVLDYKRVLAKYFPSEKPSHLSLEGFITANILIQALKQTDPPLDTEKLITTLENMRGLDLGLGTELNFGLAEHQASHKIWGTTLDQRGKYGPLDLQ